MASLPSSPEGGPKPALRGKVLDLQTMAGLPDHEVEIRLPPLALATGQQPPATAPVVMRAKSGTDGAFRMQPPARVLPGVVVHAVVSDRGGERVFSGHVRVDDEIVILVRPSLLLHGVIADAVQLCESPGFALLQERQMVGTLVHRLGRGTLDEAGAFAVRARIGWPDVPVRVKVGYDGMVFVLETDVATLSSAEGFQGRIGAGRCKVRVVDPQGAPLAGVAIAAAPRGSTMNGSFVNRSTDARGHPCSCPRPDSSSQRPWRGTAPSSLSCPAHLSRRCSSWSWSRFGEGIFSKAVCLPDQGPQSATRW